MKRKNHYIFGMVAVAATLSAVSCTDFDDYNTAYTKASAESTRTLWENIQSREDLSQFAAVAVKAGFDKELSASHTYTVWAPVNGSFDYDKYINRMDSDSVRYKFIENHIANYNYAMTGEGRNERVHTLNEKSYLLATNEDGSKTFDGIAMQGNGTPCVNGTLHTINGEASFYPNIYESIFETTGSDSIVNYFNKYKSEYLDTKNSVEGPIVDGKQTYIDSVMVSDNRIFRSFSAYLAREDSNYTMLMPTDKAFLTAYNKIKPCYNYPATMSYYEISSAYQGKNTTAQSLKVETSSMTAAYLQDSIVKKNLISPLFLNNNRRENYWLEGKPTGWSPDSLVSTRYDYMSNGREIAEEAMHGAPVAARSNGYVRTVDTLAYKSWEIWNPTISIPIKNTAYRPYTNTTAAVVSTVTLTEDEIDPTRIDSTIVTDDGEVNMPLSYLNFAANRERSAPDAYFYIPDVRSTKYNLYIEFVPARYKLGSTAREKLYKFNVTVEYASKDGSISSSTKKDFKNIETTDSNKIQQVCVGTIEFPASYYGLSCYPYLYVKSARSALSPKDDDKYDNNLRISRIFLRPVEYDNYLSEQNQDDEKQD